MYISIHVYMYICIYVYMYICKNVYGYICIYVYTSICIYALVYVQRGCPGDKKQIESNQKVKFMCMRRSRAFAPPAQSALNLNVAS